MITKLAARMQHMRKFLKPANTARFSIKASQKTDVNADVSEKDVKFASAKLGDFFQEQPKLGNQYEEDALLKSFLKRTMPENVLKEIEPDLIQFGYRVGTEIHALSLQCERETPYVQHFDAWGKRIDNLITGSAWKKMHDVSAEEGLIAIAYDRKFGDWSRLYQMVKLYLFSHSSGLYSCPLAMTDGAAKIIQTTDYKTDRLVNTAYKNLTSRDPKTFWTSGQWMTERRGGSDVALGTETIARPQADGSYTLHGYKWFSSATDADMSITLARIVDENGNYTEGTRGLSLFYLETRDETGKLNNMEIQRLKDKLGTRQLPTAELLLDGTIAHRISDEGRGVPSITPLLHLTRLHNSISAASGMRRITSLARDFSTRRQAFGKYLKDHPLHIQTLSRMEIETRGATLMFLTLAKMLGDSESSACTENDLILLRLLTPLLKLYSAKQAVSVTSEGVESFGGHGYLEDTGIPLIFRDAQVLPIWEGTTNVLSLDLLRTFLKTNGQALMLLEEDVNSRIKDAESSSELSQARVNVKQATSEILSFVLKNQDKLEVAARDLAYSMARTYIGALFIEHASHKDSSKQDVYCARKWCEGQLTPVIQHAQYGSYNSSDIQSETKLVFDNYPGFKS